MLPFNISKSLPKIQNSFAESPPSWTNTTFLPANGVSGANPAEYFCAPQNSGQGSGATNYCLGYNTTTTANDQFFKSTMSATGLGSWTRLGAFFYSGLSGFTTFPAGMFFYTNDLMVVAGLVTGGSPTNKVNSWNGASWAANTTYPLSVQLVSCASTTGLALCVGGVTSAPTLEKAVYTWNGATWSSLHQYPIGIEYANCVGYSGDIFCAGGGTNASAATKNTYYTADGITWTPTTAFPAGYTATFGSPNGTPLCAEDQGYIYCLDNANPPKLFYAQLSTSTGIGAWTQAGNAPQHLTTNPLTLFSYDNSAGALFTCFPSKTTSGNSVCEYSAPSFTITETLVCKLLSTGGSTETLALSGAASPSPSTASCSTAGSSNSITVNPSAALTITAPANSTNSAYIGNSSWTTAQTVFTFTTGSSAEGHTIYQYQVLKNTYAANPLARTTYDGIYTLAITGTYTGTGSETRCNIATSNGGGSASCTGWADNDTLVTMANITGAPANTRWQEKGTDSFTDLTGGNTRTVNFYNQLTNTYAMNPSAPSKWDGAYSELVTGTLGGSASSTICTVTLSNGGGSANCAGYADYNTAVNLPSSFASAVRGNWVNSSAYSFTLTTGGNTKTINYKMQSGQVVTNPNALTISKTAAGVTSNTTSASFSVDYGTTIKVYGQITGTYTVYVNSWIYQETSEGDQVFLNVSSTQPYYVTSPTNPSFVWITSAASHAKVTVPSVLTVSGSSSNYIVSSQVYDLNGSGTQFLAFQPTSGGVGPGNGSPPPAQTQTTDSEAIVQGVDAVGTCTSIPITSTTTVSSYTVVTYQQAGTSTTYTTRIHVDHDDDPLADRNHADGDDFQKNVLAGSPQNVTTTLTQSQVATITSQSSSCSFTTTSTGVSFSTSQLTNTTAPHPHPAIPPGSANSTNWAGYVVQSTGIQDVKGSFIIPSISCPGFIALWSGIDGYTSNTVEQSGVLGQCIAGQPVFSAWYEFYPSPMTTITNFQVQPGDKMFTETICNSPSFTVIVQDVSRNETYSTLGTNPGAPCNSAEWVLEAPSSNGILPLAPFGKSYQGLNYTGILNSDYLTVNGSSSQIGYNPSIAVTLVRMFGGSNQVLAYPLPLTTDQASFIIIGTQTVTVLINYLPWIAILLIIVAVVYASRRKGKHNRLVPESSKTRGLR